MTYCVAIKTDSGLVFASDSLTNAGIDHVSTYSKMHTFVQPGNRMFVLLASGNLATTQGVVKRLNDDFIACNSLIARRPRVAAASGGVDVARVGAAESVDERVDAMGVFQVEGGCRISSAHLLGDAGQAR